MLLELINAIVTRYQVTSPSLLHSTVQLGSFPFAGSVHEHHGLCHCLLFWWSDLSKYVLISNEDIRRVFSIIPFNAKELHRNHGWTSSINSRVDVAICITKSKHIYWLKRESGIWSQSLLLLLYRELEQKTHFPQSING